MRNPIHRKKLSRARPRPSNNYIQKITKGSALRSLQTVDKAPLLRGFVYSLRTGRNIFLFFFIMPLFSFDKIQPPMSQTEVLKESPLYSISEKRNHQRKINQIPQMVQYIETSDQPVL